MPLVGKELGEVLVAKGLLSKEDWMTVQAEYERTREPYKSILSRFDWITGAQLKSVLESHYGVPYFSLDVSTLPEAVDGLLPKQLVQEFRAIPVMKEADSLTIALVNPDDLPVVINLKEYFNDLQIKLMVCTEDDVMKFLENLQDVPPDTGDNAANLEQPTGSRPASATLTSLPASAPPGAVTLTPSQSAGYSSPKTNSVDSAPKAIPESEAGTSASIEELAEAHDPSFMLLANDLISKAIEIRCSDMHVEPEEDEVILRYLKDKKLLLESKIPKEVHSELVFCYKAISGLNLHESSKPQDKRAKIKVGNQDIEFRVTTIPGDYGETVAISFKFE